MSDDPSTTTQQSELIAQPSLVKVEPNLLRLPLFSLAKKGLHNIGGFECRGHIKRNGTEYQFFFATARNTRTAYPGPLSRKAHLALLNIASEQGYPLENPIHFTWRDLTRRMRIIYGGWTIERIKDALAATHGLQIVSKNAVWSQANNKPINTPMKATTGRLLHLYDEVVFHGDELPDGSVADSNYVVLSRWYLDNLNANYFSYLDYDLWQFLDNESPIASRLYEVSLSKFSGTSVLRINYPTLVQILPVRAERYFSDAQKQLARGFNIAQREGVIKKVSWKPRKGSTIAQLHITPGKRLFSLPGKDQDKQLVQLDESIEAMTVKQISTPGTTAERRLVAHFYTKWSPDQNRSIIEKELVQARELIDTHGKSKATKLVDAAIANMKDTWQDAKRFAACVSTIPEVIAGQKARDRKSRQRKNDALKRQAENQQQAEREVQAVQRNAELNRQWDALSNDERNDIRQLVLANNAILQKQYANNPDDRKGLVHEMFLNELEQRLTFIATWQPVWDKLSSDEQDDIRQTVAGDNAFFLKQERRNPEGTLASLQELARRHST